MILAETGGDISRFPTAEHLASWAGVAPRVHESAGKRTPVGAPHGNKWLTSMLVEAAGSVGRMKGRNYLSAQFARLTTRRGMSRAAVAVAHSMLVSVWFMLTRDDPCSDLGADWLRRRNEEAHARRLVAQFERLGHTVILDPRRLTQLQKNRGRAAPARADARLQHPYSRVCVRSRGMRTQIRRSLITTLSPPGGR